MNYTLIQVEKKTAEPHEENQGYQFLKKNRCSNLKKYYTTEENTRKAFFFFLGWYIEGKQYGFVKIRGATN